MFKEVFDTFYSQRDKLVQIPYPRNINYTLPFKQLYIQLVFWAPCALILEFSIASYASNSRIFVMDRKGKGQGK